MPSLASSSASPLRQRLAQELAWTIAENQRLSADLERYVCESPKRRKGNKNAIPVLRHRHAATQVAYPGEKDAQRTYTSTGHQPSHRTLPSRQGSQHSLPRRPSSQQSLAARWPSSEALPFSSIPPPPDHPLPLCGSAVSAGQIDPWEERLARLQRRIHDLELMTMHSGASVRRPKSAEVHQNQVRALLDQLERVRSQSSGFAPRDYTDTLCEKYGVHPSSAQAYRPESARSSSNASPRSAVSFTANDGVGHLSEPMLRQKSNFSSRLSDQTSHSSSSLLRQGHNAGSAYTQQSRDWQGLQHDSPPPMEMGEADDEAPPFASARSASNPIRTTSSGMDRAYSGIRDEGRKVSFMQSLPSDQSSQRSTALHTMPSLLDLRDAPPPLGHPPQPTSSRGGSGPGVIQPGDDEPFTSFLSTSRTASTVISTSRLARRVTPPPPVDISLEPNWQAFVPSKSDSPPHTPLAFSEVPAQQWLTADSPLSPVARKGDTVPKPAFARARAPPDDIRSGSNAGESSTDDPFSLQNSQSSHEDWGGIQ